MKKGYEIKRQQFINKFKGCDKIIFQYVNCGNDPCNPCGTVKKQATYELYAIVDGLKHLLVYKDHRRTHEEVEHTLIKRYSYWFSLCK